jgi:hypothetical protein
MVHFWAWLTWLLWFFLVSLLVYFCLISAGYWLLCSLPTMCLLLGLEGWLSFVWIGQAAFSLDHCRLWRSWEVVVISSFCGLLSFGGEVIPGSDSASSLNWANVVAPFYDWDNSIIMYLMHKPTWPRLGFLPNIGLTSFFLFSLGLLLCLVLPWYFFIRLFAWLNGTRWVSLPADFSFGFSFFWQLWIFYFYCQLMLGFFYFDLENKKNIKICVCSFCEFSPRIVVTWI